MTSLANGDGLALALAFQILVLGDTVALQANAVGSERRCDLLTEASKALRDRDAATGASLN